MHTWEYFVSEFWYDEKGYQQTIGELGRQGWELVSVSVLDLATAYERPRPRLLAVYKRPGRPA